MNPLELISRYLRSSLSRRFVLTVMAVNIIVFGLLSWELVEREQGSIDQQRFERASSIAKIVAATAGPSLAHGDGLGLAETAAAAKAADSVNYVLLTDNLGRVRADTRGLRQPSETVERLPQSKFAGKRDLQLLEMTDQAMLLAAPVTFDRKIVGRVYVGFSRASAAGAKRDSIFMAIAVGGAVVLLGALIAYLTARGVAERLGSLAAVAEKFRLGDHGVRAKVDAHDEVGSVARGLNAMLETVAASERSLQDVFRIAQIGAWRYVPSQPRLQWSETLRELYGLGPSSSPPTPEEFLKTLSGQHRKALLNLLESGDAGRTYAFSFSTRRSDGADRNFWAEARCEVSAETGERELVGVCQDITDREVAAAQLRQAQKMEAVGQLTGGLAHDFNNLLAIIIGNLDFLQEELPDDAQGESIREALSAALRGSELTRQLLAFSRRQSLSPKSIDLNGLVAGMSSLWRRTLGESIEVQIHLAEDLWPTQADPSQVESAVLNLVINARDAMPQGGTLIVETCNMALGDGDWSDGLESDIKPGDYSVVSVSDNGSGMSPEVAAKACEPFFTTKAVGAGSGLGLSMIYGFAKQSGGALKIYSEAGQGTTIRLYLPRAMPATGSAPQPDKPVVVPRAASETVLVVEDNENVMRVAARQLQELGYSVVTARNGPEALELLDKNQRVDLLFTDIVMPGGMNGFELGRLVTERHPRIKVLHTSGFTRPAAHEIDQGAPPEALLSKPYRKVDLAIKLREVLDRPSVEAPASVG